MKKYLLILVCTLSVLFLLISGCAKKPVEEIKQAEDAISNARQAGADKWAASSLKTAEDKFKEAMGLVDSKKYEEALPALEATVRLANVASHEAAEAKRAEEERIAAEAAKKAAEEERIAAEAAKMAAEANAVEAQPVVSTSSHEVRKGECLWVIAGYSETYRDPYKWQKIYEANQGKIQNPNLIFPGQVLDIPK